MIYLKEQPNKPPLFESVGCLCEWGGKILLLKRASQKSYPGLWGLPGGKVDPGETRIQAMIRELYEETGILVSAANLKSRRVYHVVADDMSFIYSAFSCDLTTVPRLTLSSEHIQHAWREPENALRLDLIPDLDACLIDLYPSLRELSPQLELFPDLQHHSQKKPEELEHSIDRSLFQPSLLATNSAPAKKWYGAFGPPAAGKTTCLKAMANLCPHLKVIADNSIMRTHSRFRYYLKRAFDEEDRSYFFHFQMDILPVRFWQTYQATNHALVDESIFSTLAYSRALYELKWLTEHEYQAFCANYKSYAVFLPRPSKILYFKCSEATALRRMQNRGRIFERVYPPHYISALHTAFGVVAQKLALEYDIVTVDTERRSSVELAQLYAPTE